ncbi:MAG: GTPase domain-containing protein [Hyphomicrobiaceae bacterium]
MALTTRLDPRVLSGRLAEVWARFVERREDDVAPETIAEKAAAEAPVIWLIGKVQSGKSSIVQGITGATEAEIGSGFRPCTRTARVFDYPAEAPVIRFLDTRGLGEVGYDPREDLQVSESKAHLLLVVARATDHQQDAVVEAVSAARRRHPEWPVVIAQTCLHETYSPGRGHVTPYPFANVGSLPSEVPETLARSLAHQRRVFAAIGGTGPILFVPIDFTRSDDGFEPRLYGLDALLMAIVEAAPHSIGCMIREMRSSSRERAARSANPLILGHAAAAAAADVVPIAGAVAVPGIQARLLHALATQRGVAWDRRALTEFGGCLGASVLTRLAAGFGIRQLAKLVPVYGQTVGSAAAAATSFATTYALGQAALVFLARRERGEQDPEAVAKAYRDALEKAFGLARERDLDDPAAEPERSPTAGASPDAAR